MHIKVDSRIKDMDQWHKQSKRTTWEVPIVCEKRMAKALKVCMKCLVHMLSISEGMKNRVWGSQS